MSIVTVRELTGRHDGVIVPGTVAACDYLARVGFDHLAGVRTPPDDEDDPASVEAARLADHARVVGLLLSAVARADTDAERHGVHWPVMRITWPDRVPGLKTWAGQMSLARIINKWLDAIAGREEGKRKATGERCADLFAFRHAAAGASGLDPGAAWAALDVGFSPSALGLPVVQRPGVELLAIVGLETLPLVSFGWRDCGFIHGGRTWRFAVEDRQGTWMSRWGTLSEREGYGDA